MNNTHLHNIQLAGCLIGAETLKNVYANIEDDFDLRNRRDTGQFTLAEQVVVFGVIITGGGHERPPRW
jgi:hypothetical protein